MPVASKMRTLGDSGFFKYKWCKNLREVKQVNYFFLNDIVDILKNLTKGKTGILFHNDDVKIHICVEDLTNEQILFVQNVLDKMFNANIIIELSDNANPITVLTNELNELVGEDNFTLTIDNENKIVCIDFIFESWTLQEIAIKRLLSNSLLLNFSIDILVEGVPPKYTLLEYLEGNKKQYIITGLYLHGNSCVETEVMPLSRNFTNFFFDTSLNQVTTGHFGISYGYNGGYSHTTYFWYGDQTRYCSAFEDKTSAILTLGQKYHFKMHNGSIYKNGSVVTKSYINTVPIPVQEFTSRLPVYLFASYGSGSISPNHMRMYSFSVKEDDKMLLDLVPVLDESKRPCMYDKISKTCFYNNGTDEFNYSIKTLSTPSEN